MRLIEVFSGSVQVDEFTIFGGGSGADCTARVYDQIGAARLVYEETDGGAIVKGRLEGETATHISLAEFRKRMARRH